MEFLWYLYDKYQRESLIHAPKRGPMCVDEFRETYLPVLHSMQKVQVSIGEETGVLYYTLSEENGVRVCSVPAYGYYYTGEKTLYRLFTRLSERVMAGGDTLFRVHLYAHDRAAQTAFSMMQFGFMAEKGLAKTGQLAYCADRLFTVRTLTKKEITDRWNEVWGYTGAIVRHLQQAPVFYPGREFTEEVYRAFYMDEGTAVHAAFSETGKLLGIIETNCEPCPFLGLTASSANAGEIYVPPEWRKTGLSQALLAHAARYEEQRGNEYLWLEHGTANPNARGFWNRYFDTYEYELVREIRAAASDALPQGS